MINKFSIFNGTKYFYSGILQNYFVFIPAKKYINIFVALLEYICGMSEKKCENITKSDSDFSPTFVNHHVLPDINFNGHSLINNNISISEKEIHLYISYILNTTLRNLNTDFTLNNCLFGSVKVTKNADLDKYKYSGYGTGFDFRSEVSFTDGSMRKNVIIFGADMNQSEHTDNKNKDQHNN